MAVYLEIAAHSAYDMFSKYLIVNLVFPTSVFWSGNFFLRLFLIIAYLYLLITKPSDEYFHLSYDVAVFQWITSCHKNRMTTRVLTLLREYVTSLTTSVTTMLIFIGNISTSKAIKSYFKSHMIKRILHSWSFHTKFIKRAFGEFNKFRMK